MTIIDRAFLKVNRPDCEIHRINVLLSFRGIGLKTYQSNEYVVISFYISGYIDEEIPLIKITAEVHIVDHLNVKMLIGIDVIDIEEMIIDFVYRSLIFDDVRTDIHVHAKDNVKTRQVIKAAKDAVIFSRSVIKMSIKMKEDSESLTNNRDYFFKSDRPGGCYYLVDADPTRPYMDYVRCYVDDIVIFSKVFGPVLPIASLAS